MEGGENKNMDYENIYDICEKISRSESITEFKKLGSGVLVTKNSFDNLKETILYNKMKIFVENKDNYPSYEKAKNDIENLFEEEDLSNYENILISKEFNNSEEMIKSLNNEEEYYILNKNLYMKISKINNLLQRKQIKISFDENECLIILFTDKDKLKFRINETEFNLVSKSNLILEKEKNDKINKNNNKESIKILIKIFIYNQELKDKSNSVFKKIEKNNKDVIYLLNNLWLEKFQSLFEYKELENHLKNIFIKDKTKINYNSIEEIFSNLPYGYINKIKNKDIAMLNNRIKGIELEKYVDKENHQEFLYFNNFQIINSIICNELINLKCTFEKIVQVELFYVGNKKIFLKFNEPLNICLDEIGFINEKNIFMPEFLLENKKISFENLNIFFKSFNISKRDKTFQYSSEDNSISFWCYSLNNNNEEDKDKPDNLRKKYENTSKETSNNQNENINLNEQIKEETNGNSEKKIKNKIEIVLLIHKFEKELDDIMQKSLETQNEIMKLNELYLFKNNWIDDFIGFYLNLRMNKNRSIEDLYNGLKNDKAFLKETKNKGESYISYSLSDLTQFDKDIYFPKNFCLINKEIYKRLIPDENDRKNNIGTNIIINNGKIIFGYEYFLEENVKYYNILICSKKRNEKLIIPEVIQSFESNKIERDLELYKLNIKKYIIDYNVKDNQIILKMPLEHKKLENEKNLLMKLLNNILICDNQILDGIIGKNKEINENYFLLNETWINLFFDCFELKEFIKINSSNFGEKVDNKIKEKNKFKSNNYLPEEYSKIIQDENIIYLDNFRIINEQTKISFEQFLNIKFEEKHKLLFSEQKAIISFKNDSILVGKIDENMIFKTEILLKFDESHYREYYLTKFIEEGFLEVTKKFNNFYKNKKANIYKGIAYNINFNEINNNITEEDINTNEENKINLKNINLKANFAQLKNKRGDTEVQNTEEYDVEINDKNKSDLSNIEIKDIEKNKKGKNRPKTTSENSKKIYLNKIEPFILFYFFIENIKNDIKQNEIESGIEECYLIDCDWMENFYNLYSYNDLTENLKKFCENEENKEINLANIIQSLDDDYTNKISKIKNIIQNNNIRPPLNDLEDKSNKYIPKFVIINPKIYISMKKNNMIDQIYLIKHCFFIDDQYLVIRYINEKLKIYQIIWAKFEYEKNECKTEIIFNYFKKIDLEKHYSIFAKNGFSKYMKKYIYNDDIINQFPNYIQNCGKVYYIDKKNKNQTKPIENALNAEPKFSKCEYENEKMNHIKFLFGLENYYNKQHYKIDNNIEQEERKCFLIKKELYDTLMKFYNFDEIKKNINKNEKFKELKNNYFGEKEFIPENDMEYFMDELMKIFPREYINNINYPQLMNHLEKNKLCEIQYSLTEYEDMVYFENHIIIYENLAYLLYDNEWISNYLFTYLIIHGKIYLIFDNKINIGILDNNIFITIAIILFNPQYLNSILEEFQSYGYEAIKSDFDNIFGDTGNFALFFDYNKEKLSKEKFKNKINIQNSIKSQSNKEREKESKKSFNSNDKRNIGLSIRNSSEQENGKLNSDNKDNIPSQLKVLLSAMIDFEIIKLKTKFNLKENNEKEVIYILDYNWWKNYIDMNNMKELYNSLIKNKTVEIMLKYKIQGPKLDMNKIIDEIIENLNKDLIKNIKNDNRLNSFHSAKANRIFVPGEKPKSPFLFYFYENFIIIRKKTMNLIKNDNPRLFDLDKFEGYFGDNQIFIIFTFSSCNLIEIGNINNNNNSFIPKLFFTHEIKTLREKTVNLLLQNGYENFSKYYLLFNDDYISEIFDEKNNSIGIAYRYNSSFKDYWFYLKKELFLKNIVKLYFSHHLINKNLNTKKLITENYYIINKDYLKENKKFFNILESLSNNDIVKQIEVSVNNNNAMNEKKISLIIKNLQSKDSINLNSPASIEEIPKLEVFNQGENSIFYINNFKLIQNEIYEALFDKQSKNNYQCFFLDDCLLVNITKNNNINKTILEVCYHKEKDEFIPKYLLVYEIGEDLFRHIQYLNSIGFEFKIFLEGFLFNSNIGLPFYDRHENEIGQIYKISSNNDININNNHNKLNSFSHNKFDKKDFNNKKNIINNNFNNANNNFINGNNNNFNKNNNGNNQKKPDKDILKLKSINEEFIYPPRIGLKNVGATCYMNATLQCFANIKKFVNYFKYKSDHALKIISEYRIKKKLCLTESFKYLIENLWPSKHSNYILSQYMNKNSNNEYFAPVKFKEKISQMNELFQGVQANDAKDLVNFLIMTLHQELNKAPQKKDLNESNLSIDQSKRDLVLSNFIQGFYNENQSLISDIFYAVNDNCTKCCHCNITKYNFQVYFFLNFPLEEVRKFKIQEEINKFMITNQNLMKINPVLYQQNLFVFQNQCQCINSVNIYDCFRYNQKIDYFLNQNAMYCSICRGQFDSSYQALLYTTPEILIIILNRGTGIQFKVKCEFTLNLNLFDFVEMKDSGYMFDLICVVTHMGENGASGHFIAYCKNPIDQDWYLYNDDLVFIVKDFKKEVIDYAMPYILFYQKKPNNASA